MKDFTTPERQCGNCLGRFSWTGVRWLMADKNGRITYGPERSRHPVVAPEIERCPLCHALLNSKTTIVEEESS